MKKILLAVGLMAACLSSSAQKVFEYGFETPSSELTPQKLEYLNFKTGDSRDTIAEGRNGSLALKLLNVDSIVGNTWERAIKIRHLGLEKNTPYRVSFWLKGSQVYGTSNTATNVQTRLMVGREYADVPLVAAGNSAYGYTSTAQDSVNWKKYTYLFFYSSDSIQEAYFKTQKPDSVFNNDHFLCLNIYNPGKYFLDDITVEKSSISGFSFKGFAIKVNFGYGVNFAGVYGGSDYNIVKLPNNCVTVKYDGVETPVLSVEVQQSGLIIFLEEKFLAAEDADKISISFNNPTDPKLALKYNDAKRPFSWDPTSDMRVLNFTDEVGGVFDENLIPVSVDDLPPFLKKATPENKSFELPLTARTFKLVYTKNVDADAASAVMAGPAGTFALDLEQSGFSDTLTFSVPASKQLLNGAYRITVSGIVSENFVEAVSKDIIDLEYGPSAAGVPDTLLNANAAWVKAGRQVLAAGWQAKLGGTITGDTINKSVTGGIRPFDIAQSVDKDFQSGFYLSPRGGADSALLTYGAFAKYGKYRLHMKAGKYVVSYNSAYWDNESSGITHGFQLMDTLKNIIFVQKDISAKSLIGGVDGTNGANGKVAYKGGSQVNTFTILVPSETDYLAQWFMPSSQGWGAMFLGGFKIISVPSEAFVYKNMLASALTQANTTLALVDSFIYNGTAKTALSNSIASYTGYSSTSPSDYTNGSNSLGTAVTNMNNHKSKIDSYFAILNNSKTVLANNANNAYAQLPIYPKLAAKVVLYDTTVIDLDNDALLVTAKDSLTYYYNYLQGNINSTAPLKFRINKSVSLAETLPIRVPAANLVAAKETLYDDDAIAAELNQTLKAYVEANIADTLVFVKDTVGTNIAPTYPALKSYIDMTGFIKNPNFYTKEKVSKKLNDNLFPGWSTALYRNDPDVAGTLASDVNPVVNSNVGFLLPGSALAMWQEVTGLPNGVYTLGMTTRMPTNYNTYLDANNVPWTTTSIADSMGIYAISGDDTLKTCLTPSGWISGFSALSLNTYVNDILVTDGKMKIGVNCFIVPNFTPTVYWGNPILRMTGKDPNFTYVNPVKNVQSAAAVKEVLYFNIQGARLSAPAKGLNIVKTIFTNGASKVEKVMIK